MSDPTVSAPVFQVLLFNRARVEAGLTALSKRAARKGLTPHTWTWGKAYTKREHVSHDSPCQSPGTCGGCQMVSRIPLTLEGQSPKFDGWTFTAALQHLDGENIVRTVPGKEIPPAFRTRGPVCDHCKHNRRRNDTYVLAHEDGRTVQVGSTCIADFLGSSAALQLAAEATFLAACRGIAEEGEEGFGYGNASSDFTAEEYLPFVAWSVRVEGWTSRTVAREREGARATADRAFILMTDRKEREKADCVITSEDSTLATEAITWAESLTDAEVDSEKGDYLHNLRAVARTGMVTFRTAGIAASAVTAYQRHLGKARARAERAARPTLDAWLGTVGKRETWTVTLDFVTGYETDYGYTTVLKFRTAEGGTLTWKASNTELSRSDVGKTYSVKGTVKKHDTYKNEKQTMISRCIVTEIVATPVNAEA